MLIHQTAQHTHIHADRISFLGAIRTILAFSLQDEQTVASKIKVRKIQMAVAIAPSTEKGTTSGRLHIATVPTRLAQHGRPSRPFL
jgi:hypothetical protein